MVNRVTGVGMSFSGTNSEVVDIVMPTFNSAQFLTDAIQAIQQQRHANWRLFVVDDASIDGTFELLTDLAEGDSRISITRLNKNSGAVLARNTALEQVSSRYLAFCDSDDLWLPEKLSIQLEAMSTSKCGICCTAYARVDSIGKWLGTTVTPPKIADYERLLRSNSVGMSTALVDTDICGKLRLPDIKRRQDYALWLELTRKGNKVIGLPDTLVKYRVHSSSLSSNKLLASYYHWHVLRRIEKLPLLSACKYFSGYCIDAIRKRM